MKGYLEECFGRFRRSVIEAGAGPEVLRDLEVAFYGGAGSVVIMVDRISQGHFSKEEAAIMLSGVRAEIADYVLKSEADEANEVARKESSF